jgi:uncharacterized protein (DUF2336 family)
MNGVASLLAELDGMAARDPRRGAVALREIEALYEAHSSAISDVTLSLFDETLLRLAPVVGPADREALARRLAGLAVVPPRIVDRLARDEAVEIAGPLIERASAVPLATLVDVARERSQEHLLSLSRRPVLREPVTDLLVERGGMPVLAAVAGNTGARFSDFGFSSLVEKSAASDDLALLVGARPDLPRPLAGRLVARASPALRARLAASSGPAAESLAAVRAGDPPLDYAEARHAIERLARTGRLNEAALAAFARERALPHTIAALAALAGVPIPRVESALVHARPEALMLLARAIELDFATLRVLMALRPGEEDATRLLAAYERLRPETARSALAVARAGR